MIVKINKLRVDVAYRDCGKLPCFSLGFDKGTYTQGRGYTSYHTDAKGRRVEKPVCMTRHLRGCPSNSVCGMCRVSSVRPPGSPCDQWRCAGITAERVTAAKGAAR